MTQSNPLLATPLLGLPYIQEGQAQKHVTHNEALRALDVLVQAAALDRDRSAPPPAPNEGDRHIVGAGATGDWAGREGQIALMEGGVWQFLPPRAGWQVQILAEGAAAVFDGTDWTTTGGSPDQLGINTGADATNRLAVASDAVLLTHDGAGHQLKVNKATAGDTASLLFQTNWSGRAEMGLAGDDGFSIKVSADGAAWTDALAFDAATGIPSGAAVQQAPEDTTTGRLARADYAYGPGNVVGPVTEAAGLPTGAVIERGTTPDGEFTRFADGTLICTMQALVNVATTSIQSFPFPAPFVADPSVSFSQLRAYPDPAIEMNNIRAVASYAGGLQHVAVTLKTAYPNTQNSAQGRTLVLTAIGRWF